MLRKCVGYLNSQGFRDYHLIFIKCEVLLCVDVFGNFRSKPLGSLRVDHGMIIESTRYDSGCATIKYCCRVGVSIDSDMLHTIDNMKRGG